MPIISQGAEAVIHHESDRIIKIRVSKSYRHDTIDKTLRKSRTRREAKVLSKLHELNIPAPILLDMNDRDMRIEMSYLHGPKVRDVINENYAGYARQIGALLATLHNHNIIHGDLTTSNMIVHKNQVHLIDFGLSFFSHKIEDKAVDLNVLYRTIESTHNAILEQAWSILIDSYAQGSADAQSVLERLERVQGRGRNKSK